MKIKNTFLKASSLTVNLKFKDQRFMQIFSLIFMILWGKFVIDIQNISYSRTLTIIFCVIFFTYASKSLKILHHPLYSNIITGLSIIILLNTNYRILDFIAIFLAIYSKKFIKYQGNHIFNPANFGIMVAVLLGNGKASINPGQWGNLDLFLVFIVIISGFLVTNSVKRLDTALCFIATFIFLNQILFYFRVTQKESLDYLGIPLILFSFFMITDPKTTPNARSGRIFFAILCALASIIFSKMSFITFPPFYLALFFTCIFVPLINIVFPEPRFRWNQS